MSKLIWFIHRLLGSKDKEGGATMVEYGLMVALIALVCVTAVALLGTNLKVKFLSIANSI